MIKSECIDRNEVIRYYHLSFNDFNDYEIPNSLIVNWQLPSFDSQNIELINEKKEYIISEYKKKYFVKNVLMVTSARSLVSVTKLLEVSLKLQESH